MEPQIVSHVSTYLNVIHDEKEFERNDVISVVFHIPDLDIFNWKTHRIEMAIVRENHEDEIEENHSDRSTDWIVTLWEGAADGIEPHFATDDVRYYCFAFDWTNDPENPRAHIHLFIQFNSRKRFNSVKAIFGQTSHIEKRRGTAEEAKAYCLKTHWNEKE